MKLLTNEVLKVLPPLNKGDGTAYLKLFTPDANFSWFMTEFDPLEGVFFGVVTGTSVYPELAYFDLEDLLKVRGKLGLPIERDIYFKPRKIYNVEPFELLV
jgi:hypothetical protein